MKSLILRLIKWQVVRYLISGASAVVTDLVLLFVFVHFFHMWYLLASVIAFIAAVYVSFFMQKFFTFNDYTRGGTERQAVFYLGLQVFNLVLNTFLMYVSVDLIHIPYLMSQVLISLAMAVSNFFIYKYLVFPQVIPDKKNSSCPSCSKTDNIEWGSKNGFTLVKCNLCGLIFVSPMPRETAIIYDKTYFSGGKKYGYVDYDRDKESMRPTLELYLKHIEQGLEGKGKLLDVGCATGYFMGIARQYGWEVEGVEISEHAASMGRLKGLTIHTGILEDINLPEKSFDVITLFDVIEHLRNPKSTILEVRRLLKEGGIIVVTTPDAGSLWAQLLGPRWQLVVPPEHLVLFNRKNFGNLLTGIGLVPFLVTNIGKCFTISYIFQTLFHWQGLFVWNILARTTDRGFLSKLKIPINLHDTFFIIAKKQ